MSDNAISAHGTLVARQPNATPGAFTTVAELGDITPPSMGRNNIETTTQNNDIDAYIQGVLRRGELTFPVNFLPSTTGVGGTDHLTGLYKSLIDKAKDGWRITFPDGTVWILSGGISNIQPEAPVDGALRATITVRPTGLMSIGGVSVG